MMAHTQGGYVQFLSRAFYSSQLHQSSDNCIGDCGPEGLKSFAAQHQCDSLCKRLDLRILTKRARQQTLSDSDDDID